MDIYEEILYEYAYYPSESRLLTKKKYSARGYEDYTIIILILGDCLKGC